MGREKKPISHDEFEEYKARLFVKANDELKLFAKKLADYCWELDEFAVIQNWEKDSEALIVFGVPPSRRIRKDAKNYFSIYRVLNSNDQKIKCEVCFPRSDSRISLLKKYDVKKKLSISTIDQCEGFFEPNDYNYVIKLINAARNCRVIKNTL